VNRLKSSLAGLAWPAMPDPAGAQALALQFQLEQSQWWSRDELEHHQLQQLQLLLRHAYATVPFWRERLAACRYEPNAAVTPQWLATLPVLTRREVQDRADALTSRAVPATHGGTGQSRTSGSTGVPIVFSYTGVTQIFWRGFTLRDHLWHGRDMDGRLAVIRSKVDRAILPGWGDATDAAFATGSSAVLNIETDIGSQLRWLCEHDPDYLLTHPSNLHALVQHSAHLGVKPGALKQARTFGETLPDDLRALCRDVWRVPLTDVYSAEETGYIALQCPQHEHYHVQSEGVLVEIVDESGQPCVAGAIGRVLVTTLHNFAMPLIRYDLGDYAQAGADCACGRGLPVLRRVMGRRRNLVTFPDGRRHWPSLPSGRWTAVAPVQQYQLVQHTLHEIEARLVVERALTAAEEEQLIAVFQELLGYPFRFRLTYLDVVERGAGFKYEDFVSYIGAGRTPDGTQP